MSIEDTIETIKALPEDFAVLAGPYDSRKVRVISFQVADLKALVERLERLTEALDEAIDQVDSWGSYASDYFQEKHDLAGNLSRLRAALAGTPEGEEKSMEEKREFTKQKTLEQIDIRYDIDDDYLHAHVLSDAYDAGREAAVVEIREAVANYMYSEGCGCCQDHSAHLKHTDVLGELLGVEKYDDNSGYNFHPYATQEK